MHTTHAMLAHAVLIPLLFAALAAVLFVALHLDTRGRGRRVGDPLDVELVRRWNAGSR